MNFYRFIVPRLNGKDIEREFDYYLGLVRKGIAGFIIFGGKLDSVRKGVAKLQAEADGGLIIASDLERGLGQQIEGGALFPPAMGIAEAFKEAQKSVSFCGSFSPANPPVCGPGREVGSRKLRLLRKVFRAIALEARYAGINTIFAPVLDINTNPKNPIIATRAFGEDPETVSFFGCEMIRIFRSHGIAACGKHFPGHGDTGVDSHIRLPSVNKDLQSLRKEELAPFRAAVDAGVKMIMLGHLKVPALEPSGIPVSLSKRAVGYLRNRMGFKGIIITDALNMGGIGRFSEEEASLMALEAGVDILLHPTDPDRVAAYLEKKLPAFSFQRPAKRFFKKGTASHVSPDFERNRKLSGEIARKAIRINGKLKPLENPFLIILSDDEGDDGKILRRKLKAGRFLRLKEGDKLDLRRIPEESELIVAIFSKVRAWKGGSSSRLLKTIKRLERSADVFISFGSPYLLDGIKGKALKIYAYWDSDMAQDAVADMLFG